MHYTKWYKYLEHTTVIHISEDKWTALRNCKTQDKSISLFPRIVRMLAPVETCDATLHNRYNPQGCQALLDGSSS